MNRTRQIIESKIAQNLFAWTIIFVLAMALVNAENKLISAGISVLVMALPIYVNNLIIAPYSSGNYLKFAVLFLLNAALFTALIIGVLILYADTTFEWRLLNLFGFTTLVIIVGYSIKLSRDNILERRQTKEAKLRLLKEQLNPHFLFNTLNNLYGLSITKSEKLPDLMLKLSELLRYSLYETDEVTVPLDEEVLYLENYLALEKVRLEATSKVHFNQKGDFSSLSIAPMLLIVFVENAFKHTEKSKLSSIEVGLEAHENQLFFSCKNSYDKNVSNELNTTGGIGLKNVRQRLNLLYPKCHDLTISEGEHYYTVELHIRFQ